MSTMSTIAQKSLQGAPLGSVSSLAVKELHANELIFAVVGPVGSGTSEVAEALRATLASKGCDAHVLKARDVIAAWAHDNDLSVERQEPFAQVQAFQDAGDEMRKSDKAAVARKLLGAVRKKRAERAMPGFEVEKGVAVQPDGRLRAYILDSLKHPAEVGLLRSVYQEAFCLIGVVCEEDVRRERLRDEKFREAGADAIDDCMMRDENAAFGHGQKVGKTFYLADFFVDNTPSRFIDKQKKESNPAWDVVDQLGRLVDILTHSRIVRPRPNETGMFHAFGAQMRSACLSRQVGAAVMDKQGNLVSTGTNEVPRAGGGVYGSNFEGEGAKDVIYDRRCTVASGQCSNTVTQNEIIDQIIKEVPLLGTLPDLASLRKQLKATTSLGQLIEFSRAVHAEMDALLSAARQGISAVGTRLFVTTFPCHSCARHIVAAGVDEVQYIEPYPKSRALKLHGDAIVQSPQGWSPPSNRVPGGPEPMVLFRPFTGVAPRQYRRAFLKDRDLKNDETGEQQFGEPDATMRPELLKISYTEMEARLEE